MKIQNSKTKCLYNFTFKTHLEHINRQHATYECDDGPKLKATKKN